MPLSPLLATGSNVKISIEASIPRAALTAELSSINAAMDVTGVMALKSEWPSSLWVIKRLSNRVWESKSVPPIETKLPLAYLMVNLPSLSDVVEFSLASQVQLLSSSIHTSAPEIYPSTTTPSVCLYPSTVTDADLVPPDPVHEIEKVLLPTVEMVTACEPDTAVDDVHSAEQDVALDEDHVSVEVFSNKTEVGSAEKLIVGAGVAGGVGVLPPPPPPPPPQEAIKNKEKNNDRFKRRFFLNKTSPPLSF